jgi:hypothetical protein
VVAAITTVVHQVADTRLADDLCVVAARIGEADRRSARLGTPALT